MSEHAYTLEPYKGMKTRHICPQCKDKRKTFKRYIDRTGQHIHPDVGRCERVDKCGYHYKPKDFFKNNATGIPTPSFRATKRRTSEPAPSIVPTDVFTASLSGYDKNNLIPYLIKLFGEEGAQQLIERYFIGTSKHWPGATVFWQISKNGEVRAGKIMLFSPDTGKRVKHPFNHVNWAHKAMKWPNFNLKQCFFGEHLLRDESKPVAIVESERAAIVCSAYLPNFTWIATGAITNLTAERCKVLKGREVILIPDLNALDKWREKAKELSGIARFKIYEELERFATDEERQQGFDIEDFLIKIKLEDFNAGGEPTLSTPEPEPVLAKRTAVTILPLLTDTPEPEPEPEECEDETFAKEAAVFFKKESESWNPAISELESFFSDFTPPTGAVRLDSCSVIEDVNKFILSHFAAIKANNGHRAYLPYLHRLQALKTLYTAN